jgi:hypothetical protein
MMEHETPAEECGSVIREGAHREPGKQTEGAIEQADEASGEISGEAIAGNGELGDHPLRARTKMGKNAIEEPLQLRRKKAVEKEVGNYQVVASAGIPFERIVLVETNALVGLGTGAPNAAIEKPQHGVAGVDDIHGEGGIGRQQAGQEASIPVA